MKRISLALLFWVGALSFSFAQHDPDENIPARAVKTLDHALMTSKVGNTEAAITEIESLIDKYPEWIRPRHELSRIFYESGQTNSAILHLEAAIKVDTASQLQELYTLGRLYEKANDQMQAIACYNQVIAKAGADASLAGRASESKSILEEKRHLWTVEDSITFVPFDTDINTPEHESLGQWTLDGQYMVFTRFANNQEDIIFASFDSIAGLWQIYEYAYNSPYHEGAHALSPDGNYLIFTSCDLHDSQGGCDLYLSFKQGDHWTRPTDMGPAFNSAAYDGQPSFGLDGLSLFFSSTRSGGYGGRDIWYVYQQGAGKWSRPINAGPAINTPDNEKTPFVHFDGQTIYFMRDGSEGLGGDDLYIARKDISGQWQTATNMGAPINTGGDEGALTLHPDGRRAIITRLTEENKNDLFTFELPEKFRAAPLQALRAIITDAESQLPVNARLEIFEITENDTIRKSQWTDKEGKISAVAQKGKAYGLFVEAEGYLLYSQNLAADTSEIRDIKIQLTPISVAENKTVVLKNIFFESGSAELLPASDPELKKLLWNLRKNETLRIEIGGHTDDVGNDADNQKLSEARAKAVYDYLTYHGITSERISYVGYGETQPIADNSTEAGKQENRRTEFKVLAK